MEPKRRAGKLGIPLTKSIRREIECFSAVDVIRQMKEFLKEHNLKDASVEADHDQYDGSFSGLILYGVVNKPEKELQEEIDQRLRDIENNKCRRRDMYEKLKKEFES